MAAKLKPHERAARDEAILKLMARGFRPSAIAAGLGLDPANTWRDIVRLRKDGLESMHDVIASERWLQVEGLKADMQEAYTYLEKSKAPKIRRTRRSNDSGEQDVVDMLERDGEVIQTLYLIRNLRADIRSLLGLDIQAAANPGATSVADISRTEHERLRAFLTAHPERADLSNPKERAIVAALNETGFDIVVVDDGKAKP